MSDAVAETTIDGDDHDEAVEVPVWQPVIDRARQALEGGDAAALAAIDEEIEALIDGPREVVRRGLPQLNLYRSLIAWKQRGEFVRPSNNAQAAKIQMWELDAFCPDIEYRRQFIDHAVKRYPNRRGFALFQRVLANVSESRSRFKTTKEDVQILRRPGATMTVIGFGAIRGAFAGIGWDLFERVVIQPLNANFIVLEDFNERIFLGGISSIGNYDASVAAVREILAEFADTTIVATGASGGVFGAINFAADLGIRHIVAFAGPTSIEVGEENFNRQIYRRITADIEAGRFARVNLAEKVNGSAIERIDFFVAGQSKFDMAQMNALRSQCPQVHPIIFEHTDSHVVTDYAIEDGSIFEAFRSGPKTPGLAGG